MQNAMTSKSAPRAAFDDWGRSHTLETVLDGVCGVIFGRGRHAAEDARLTNALRGMVLGLIDEINELAGEQMLYVNECAGHFFLFGRPDRGSIDRLMMLVAADIDGFAKLWCRLNEAIRERRTVEDACPYKKERVSV